MSRTFSLEECRREGDDEVDWAVRAEGSELGMVIVEGLREGAIEGEMTLGLGLGATTVLFVGWRQDTGGIKGAALGRGKSKK